MAGRCFTPPVPPRVNLVRINAKTGKLARPDDETVILEAFKLGTQPTRNGKQMVVRGGTGGVKQRPAITTETVGAGTGGLY